MTWIKQPLRVHCIVALARACALHLLCRDAGFLHDAGMKMAGLRVLLGDAACCCACARAIQLHTARSAPARLPAHACALHLLCRDAGFCNGAGCCVSALCEGCLLL